MPGHSASDSALGLAGGGAATLVGNVPHVEPTTGSTILPESADIYSRPTFVRFLYIVHSIISR
jgi:hypothetical protein